ncbi:hypothetical protein [Paraburkholderia largidicola]|uniref:Uncharacterized protein n=1 Tax=Paraburkholderia largidicola TaxID=3014751 RepID=A0A7I8C496_9BURK|nr:hypothetical protein [Paraburkholderia sp. PGU16]BCF95138.1 hypothetical protein PPGU16_82050 [Paraburkholderia sp. PGU16]
MEDFAYLARESNAAWLAGRGDGRFERYEKFYQSERAVDAAGFDLEKANEGYGEYVGSQPSPLLSFLNAPWVGRVAIALFALYMGTRVVPQLAKVGPAVTGIALVAAFIGLRVFHRRNRKRR